MACNYCRAHLYIKTIQYQAHILAPLTRAEELRQELEDLTGERYMLLNNKYCPMCGSKIKEATDE